MKPSITWDEHKYGNKMNMNIFHHISIIGALFHGKSENKMNIDEH
jgi:hypothetical protein